MAGQGRREDASDALLKGILREIANFEKRRDADAEPGAAAVPAPPPPDGAVPGPAAGAGSGADRAPPPDADGKAAIRISKDRLTAVLVLEPAVGRGAPPTEAHVRDLLARNRITYGLREDAIREALEACRAGRATETVAAAGLAPEPGAPGDIEYFFDRQFQGPIIVAPGPDGKIDFRDVKWIPNVAKDQLLARVKPAVPGRDGRDVHGGLLAAAQLPAVYLVPGANVRAEKEGTEFRAEINGCVQLNGTLLAVMNLYVVNSDVDYRSGNVRFEGNVLVSGTLRKGFEVEASGDVVVLQNAEPCVIRAGRDVFVHGGVLGSGKGGARVEAGRHATVGYAENAWIEAQGDIRIEDFALQSFLYSGARIVLDGKRGSLVGGEAVAARGLEARILGTQAGVRTLAVAGVDFVVKRKLKLLEARHAELQESAIKVDRMLKSLLELSGRGALPPSKAEALRIIVAKRKSMAKDLHAAQTRIAELKAGLEGGPASIRITEAAYPEVTLAIRGIYHKLVETVYRSLYLLDAKGEHMLRRKA